MLSKQAFNGLLKTLEEPPEKLKFILATTEARKIPVTVLSRCQRFDLKRVSLEVISSHLKKISQIEKGKISDESLNLLARASEGSVRDAISLLDRTLILQSLNPEKVIEPSEVRKILGLVDKSKLINLLKYVLLGDEKNALSAFKEIFDQGLDAKMFLNDILEILYLFSRRINLGSIEKDLFISEGELKLIDENSKNVTTQDLALFWQLTIKTIEDLKTLPGVGEYTSRAIMAIVFDQPMIPLDGNIERVIKRIFYLRNDREISKENIINKKIFFWKNI